MDLMMLRVYQQQILYQCEFILISANQLNEALVQRDTRRSFYAIQNLLNSAANVAKALWGQAGRRAAEGQELRDSIGIDDSSPLKQVDMRNNFEHFDDRLDRWWKESKRHNFVDLLVGPLNSVVGPEETDMFRVFNPVTTELIFWGQCFNLQGLINEVLRILPKVQEEAGKPHWEVPSEREPSA